MASATTPIIALETPPVKDSQGIGEGELEGDSVSVPVGSGDIESVADGDSDIVGDSDSEGVIVGVAVGLGRVVV
jgi:hypothetical protein